MGGFSFPVVSVRMVFSYLLEASVDVFEREA
jgi:hypothetical protein